MTEAPVLTAKTPPGAADDSAPYVGYTFVATGYRVAYSVSSGALPTGLMLNPSTGVLSGIPSEVGSFDFTVTASNDSGDDTTPTLTITVSDGVPAQIVIEQQPVGDMPSRTPLSTQPIIEVLDDSGYLVADDTVITVTANGTAAVLGADDTASTGTTGIAAFSNITLGGLVDDTYTLTFTLGALTVTSDPIQVLPGAATNLQVATPLPVAAPEAGLEMTTQPVVEIRDADTNLVTGDDTTMVVLTPATGGFVGPTQDDTAFAIASGGVATFSGVRFGGPTGVPTVLTFTAQRNNIGPALTDDSATVESTAPGPAYKLVVTTEATSPSQSGVAFPQPPVVTRQDMAGNTVGADPQATIIATLVEELEPYDVLVGPRTQTTTSGVATFTGLGISGLEGSIYTIRFTSPGLVPADDTVVPSSGTAERLSLTSVGPTPSERAVAPGDASYDDTTLAPQPKVQIVDSGNNPIWVPGVTVTASIESGIGVLIDDTAVTDDSGLATFTGLSLDGLTGPYGLRFSATGYTPIDDTIQMFRGAQTVTLSAISPKTLGDAPFAISAGTSSGLRAFFSTTTPAVCSVRGNAVAIDDTTGATVTLVGAGDCTIIASQPGNLNFEPAADDSVTFSVARAQQAPLRVIAPTSALAGQTLTLRTIGGSGTGAVTFDDTDAAGICALDSSTGSVTITGTGNVCEFTATKAADANYDDTISAPVTITIPASGAGGRSPQTVAFTSDVPASPIVDDTYVATAAATSGLTPTIGVQSGSLTVCTATSGQSPVTITFVGAGTCVIEATEGGDSSFAPAAPVALQTIEVYADSASAGSGVRNQSILFAALPDRRIGSPAFGLTATATSELSVAFSTSTTNACAVTPGGIVTLIATGTCTIVAAQVGNTAFAPADPVTRSFTVTAGLPSAPRILSTSVGTGAVTLAFAAPDDTGGSAILGYTIQATSTAGGPSVSMSSCITSPCTITGLTDDSAYTVAIAAINVIGTGPYSMATPEVTPKSCTVCVGAPGGSPGGPGGPTGEFLDDTTIVLSWSQPSDLGDDTFIGYDIYYRPAGSAWPASPQQTITPITTVTTTITGLTPGVVYEFLIVVVTQANPRVTPPSADDPTATPITVGVPTAPMPPRDLTALAITDTTIMLSWAYPASNGGSPITGYSVTMAPGATCSTPFLDDTTWTASCVVSGLTAGTTYAISARAINAIGISTAAVTSHRTPGVAPNPTPVPASAPVGVVAVAGNAQAMVSWQPPASSGMYAITSYQVVTSPGDRSCITETLTCTVTGLANGTEYSVRVRALTGAGWGAWSQAVSVTPVRPITEPGPVRDIRLVKVTAGGTAVLRWTIPLDDGGSPVIAFRVGTRMVGAESYVRVRPDATTTRVRITGLESGRSYWVRVRAGNADGFGPGVRYESRVRIPSGS